MADNKKSSSWQNFLTVTATSAAGPLKLTTLGAGILAGLLLPQTGVIITISAIVATGVMIFNDLRDDNFVQKTLTNSVPEKLSTQSSFKDQLTAKLIDLNKNLDFEMGKQQQWPEVAQDLKQAQQTLGRIIATLNHLDTNLNLDFTQEYLPKIILKLIRLSNQERLAREFLQQNSILQLDREIADLQNQKNSLTDKITLSEYEKTIQMKQEQVQNIQNLQNKLSRIDSSIARIKAVLEQVYTYFTKLGLQDEIDLIDESEILTQSLKQISTDIDDIIVG